MRVLAWHLMLRTRERCILAPSVSQRRLLASTVHEVAKDAGLLAFRGSDTHVHVLVASNRADAGRVAHDLTCALHWRLRLKIPFEASRLKPVESQAHLESAVDYILRQDERHGFSCDPFHDASILPDLLGLRVLGPDVAERLGARFPRLSRGRLVELLGVDTLEAGDAWDLLSEAAAAAVGRSDVRGNHPLAVRARRALVAVVDGNPGYSDPASALVGSRSSVQRLRARPADAALVRAIRLQVGFRSLLRARAEAGVTDGGGLLTRVGGSVTPGPIRRPATSTSPPADRARIRGSPPPGVIHARSNRPPGRPRRRRTARRGRTRHAGCPPGCHARARPSGR